MLLLRDLPRFDTLQRFAERYPDMDIESVSAFLTLLRVASDLIGSLDQYLERYGLLQGRWMVLVLLMREPNLTTNPSILASKAGVTRATMTGLLENLERDGLIERRTDHDDRRRARVCLTAAGVAKLDELMPDYYARVARLLSDFSAADKQTFIQLLERLNQRVPELQS